MSSIRERAKYDGPTGFQCHQTLTDFSQYIVTYPVSRGKMINVVALISYPDMHGTTHEGPWSSSATTEELLDHFDGWETHVVSLLRVRAAVAPPAMVTNIHRVDLDAQQAISLGDQLC